MTDVAVAEGGVAEEDAVSYLSGLSSATQSANVFTEAKDTVAANRDACEVAVGTVGNDEVISDEDVDNSSDSVEVIEPADAEHESDQHEDSCHVTSAKLRQSTNPFLDMTSVSDSLQCNIEETATLKSNSSCTYLPTVMQFEASDGMSDSSPMSATCDDVAVNYIRLRDSAPSSRCSASPFESPTHIASSSYRSDLPDDMANCRPDSLYLSRSVIQRRERQWMAKKGSYSSLSECDSSHSESMDALIEAATSTPLHAQGTVAMDGDMITFVADGINELIKRSRNDSLSASFVTNQTPRSTSTGSMSSSTSGWSAMSPSSHSRATRSPSLHPQSPEDIPPIDPRALQDLEVHARRVADSVDYMIQTLTNKLYKMSSYTYNCLDVYKEAVDSTCDSVDASIKSMYALMAKCEELNKTVGPIYELKDQIREIKRLLDLFEARIAMD